MRSNRHSHTAEGFEPAQPYGRGILSPLRLPIPPSRQKDCALRVHTLVVEGALKAHKDMEAAPGFEPGITDLQSTALPLGYAATLFLLYLCVTMLTYIY